MTFSARLYQKRNAKHLDLRDATGSAYVDSNGARVHACKNDPLGVALSMVLVIV